ncbi:aldehyde ferredoxin oxidoreductase [Ignicoccus islandicus DSM 13165]|uniref:Aldehyde ferredoxin oxidoreductase n=1 Tax=Ignicoccus islandicus DSM 13165 TaxID=940295 RepID=A0A0U2M9I5_9CREN|nr:aldehyde ferredoxin oxidoreductase family protein [Ignicoccus islandicus]ALU11677.1 aldehyde ferredoxin oxidoreductase [Ignicoccus islandicus DSM 13165]
MVNIENRRILYVDLTRNSIEKRKIPKDVSLRFWGGKGFCTYYLYKEVGLPIDPLSEHNVAVIAPGALSGYAPGSGKTCFGTISPLTGLIHDSYAGEVFGPKLRMAGIDAVIIKGRASEPVYLYIEDDYIDIIDANDLWGKSVSETVNSLRTKHGKVSVAAIGRAGENKVRYASIIVDKLRAAGRGGIGAVWGSKNLKAIAVKTANHIEEPAGGWDEWRKYVTELYVRLGKQSRFSKYGTNNALVQADMLGMAPHYNFKFTHLGDVGELKGDEIIKRAISVAEEDPSTYGYMCPVKCPKVIEGIKSEYEHLGMLGAADGIYKLDDVLKAIKTVNELGLDSISTGNVIGWLMETTERGYKLYDIKWGEAEKQRELMKLIAERKEIGALLAEGLKRITEIVGYGKEWAVHVKGLEAPAWDPRGLLGFGLSYATADVGASHLRGWPRPHKPPKEPAVNAIDSLIEDRDRVSVQDHMGTCVFLPYNFEDFSKLLEIVYGISISVEELRALSWRTESLSRLWAIKSGIRRSDDTVPPRWMEPAPTGPAKGLKAFLSYEDMEEAKTEYYKKRGWSLINGIPLPSTLKSLDLHEFVTDSEYLIKALDEMDKL